MAGGSMVVFRSAPIEAIAGCAKGDAMADALTTRTWKYFTLHCDDEKSLCFELFYNACALSTVLLQCSVDTD